jgi:type IV fimbrial biogenesis protein FimT
MSIGARSRGFTLLELLAVIAIVSILAVVGIPSFNRLIATQRVKNTASDLFMSLVRARSEALKRGANVTVSPNAAGWQAGWTIPDPTSGSTALIESHAAVSGITVTGPTSVLYQSSGHLKSTVVPSCSASPPVACFVIKSSNRSGIYSCVSIDISGRPYNASGVTTC